MILHPNLVRSCSIAALRLRTRRGRHGATERLFEWIVDESVLVKRILRKHGYPPDKQEPATATVLEQAELLCGGWA